MTPRRLASAATLAAVLAVHSRAAAMDPRDVDRTADPCVDFYAYANGAWRAANPIPAGKDRWSRRVAARDENRREVSSLLQSLAARTDHPRGSVEQQLGDHFASCMDERAIDAAGITPLARLLAEIASVRDDAGVQRAIRRLHEIAVPVPFALASVPAYHDPALFVVNVTAGGLGLPDRDHYLGSEPRRVEARARYRDHVLSVLRLGGATEARARAAAADVLALETRLAEASLPVAQAADPARTAHRTPFAQLGTLAPHIDWVGYFAEAHLPQAEVNVAEPEFLRRVDRELVATPVAVWRDYLTWHALASASPWLARAFADEAYAFRDAYLAGAAKPMARADRCLASTEALLGEPLGRVYAERRFPPAAKARVRAIVGELVDVLKDEVVALSWMTPPAREQALAKLEAYTVEVGYPDAATDHSALVVRRDAFWANVAAARRFGVEQGRRRVGTRTARQTWLLPPSSPDAYIDVQLNQIVLPAGFLQAPAFDLEANDAANYGAIGVGVAHDLTHAIDPGGGMFDAEGRARDWWTDADRSAFEQRGRCVAEQYAAYEIAPGIRQDGQRVRGEAIGDLAGVRIAYRALERSLRRRAVEAVSGFDAFQQFFLAWGQYRGVAESPELQLQMAKEDSHAVGRFRVNGPLAMTPEFAQAFACRSGTPMATPVEKRCKVF